VARPEIVLFDAGNTLVELDYDALEPMFRRHGVETDAAGIRRAGMELRPDMNRYLLARTSHGLARFSPDLAGRRSTESGSTRAHVFSLLFDRLRLPDGEGRAALHEEFAAAFPDLWTWPPEGALETVRALREDGYRIGVVSNSNGRVAELLEIAGFRGVFETVVDSALVGVEKPDPEIFRIALGRLGAAPESAVYVGDVPCVDLVGAAAAGIRGVLVDPLDLFPEVAAPRIRTLFALPRRLEAFAD